jgi:hypothetical protein
MRKQLICFHGCTNKSRWYVEPNATVGKTGHVEHYGHLKSKLGDIAACLWSCQVPTLKCDMSFPPYCPSAVMLLLCTSRPLTINFKMQKSPVSCCSSGNSVSIHCSIDMQIWNVRRTGTRESLIFCPNGRRFVTGTNTESAQHLGHVYARVHSVHCISGRFSERSGGGEYECTYE